MNTASVMISQIKSAGVRVISYDGVKCLNRSPLYPRNTRTVNHSDLKELLLIVLTAGLLLKSSGSKSSGEIALNALLAGISL